MKREEYGGGNGSNHIPQYMYMCILYHTTRNVCVAKVLSIKIFT